MRGATPESALVDLETFVLGSAKYHCADAAVAQRQRLGPLAGRLVVHELEGRLRCGKPRMARGHSQQTQRYFQS